jgi:hypothetical protein
MSLRLIREPKQSWSAFPDFIVSQPGGRSVQSPDLHAERSRHISLLVITGHQVLAGAQRGDNKKGVIHRYSMVDRYLI